jgi:hypothetical protein
MGTTKPCSFRQLPVLFKSRRPQAHPRRDLEFLPCVNIIRVRLRLGEVLEQFHNSTIAEVFQWWYHKRPVQRLDSVVKGADSSR